VTTSWRRVVFVVQVVDVGCRTSMACFGSREDRDVGAYVFGVEKVDERQIQARVMDGSIWKCVRRITKSPRCFCCSTNKSLTKLSKGVVLMSLICPEGR
jgi:hypothetical protein